MFITSFLRIGGEELSTLTLASELQRQGHTVSLLSTPGGLLEEYERRGIEVTFGRVAGRRPLGVVLGAGDVRRAALDRHPDLIHTQSVVPTIMAFLATRALPKARPKVIWHDRGIHEWSYPVVAKCFNFLTDFVIANSDYERDRLVRNRLSQDRVRRVHNSINLEFPNHIRRDKQVLSDFGISDDHFVVGIVSRLARTKGHVYLLRATPIIAEKIGPVRILIVGGGPLEAELKALADELQISDLVTFAGFRRELPALYSAMDLVVIPSLREPFGNVAIEAAAFGLPVVASAVEGLPEAVDGGRTGMLVPPKHPARLAEAILYLAENPSVARQMGQAGRERVRRYFLPTRVAEEVEDVYRHVTAV
ncbi:MAG: glycosyltransferase family 4 protein [Anaerolineae bacterium]